LPGEFEREFSKSLPLMGMVRRRMGARLSPAVEESSRNAIEVRGRGEVEECLAPSSTVLCGRNPASATIFVFMRVAG
jgi:hypothetical protein